MIDLWLFQNVQNLHSTNKIDIFWKQDVLAHQAHNAVIEISIRFFLAQWNLEDKTSQLSYIYH